MCTAKFDGYEAAKQYVDQQYYLYVGHRSAVDISDDMICELTKPEEEFGDLPPQYLIISNQDGLTPTHLDMV